MAVQWQALPVSAGGQAAKDELDVLTQQPAQGCMKSRSHHHHPRGSTQGAAAEVHGMFSASQPTLAHMGQGWARNVASALALKRAKDIQENIGMLAMKHTA